jgi:hypothetical protein
VQPLIKELRQLDTITVYPSFLGPPVYQAASWGRPGHNLVALVSHGPGASRSAFAGNGRGIKTGIPIACSADAGSPDADATPSASSDTDTAATPSASSDTDTAATIPSNANARSTGASAAYAGTGSHRGGANTGTCPNSGTAYSASHIAYGCTLPPFLPTPQPSAGGNQQIVNWVKFWDTIAVILAYPWLCCGVGLMLLVPVALLFLEIKGRRPPPKPPEPTPQAMRREETGDEGSGGTGSSGP